MNSSTPKICRHPHPTSSSARATTVVQVIASIGLWLVYTAVALAQVPATPSSYQDVAALETAARSAAEGALPPLTAQQRLIVGPVQGNAQLERCLQPIKPVISPGQHMKDRLMVELRCPDLPATVAARGPSSDIRWHIYVPVRVVGTSNVVVATHSILQGAVLTANDLRVEQHDLSELPMGFIDDPSVAAGLTAARAIAGGSMLTNQQLAAAKIVQRGQSVTLVADAGGMSVRMAGRAMGDAMVNQRLKVQNLSSGKVVEGVARSEQVVEIVFQ